MAAEFIAALIEANLAAAAAVLIVLALRRPARRLIGPRLAYALWLAVPVAMLATVPARIITKPAPMAPPSFPVADTAGLIPTAEPPLAIAAPAFDSTLWIAGGWVAGAVLFLAMVGICQWRAIAAFGLIAADRQGFVRASNLKSSPALIGVLRPRIVLPADFETRFAPSERAMIIAHERAHLNEGHLLTNALTALIGAINWFNPLIHVAAWFMRLDQELACDAAVVERFPGERRTYAQAMLKSQLVRTSLPLGCTWPARSNPMLKERIEMLAIKKPTLMRRLAGGCALTTLCAAAGLAAWAASPAEVVFEPAEAVAALEARAAAETTAAPEAAAVEEAAEAPGETETPEAPQPATAQPALPPVPNLASGSEDMNLGAPVTVSGTIERVDWVNPRAGFRVRDASGEVHFIQSETPNSLIRAGGTRQALAAGTPMTAQGYRSVDGASIYASPIAMTSNGQPLFPLAAANAEATAAQQARQAAICGPQPAPPVGPASDMRAFTMGWIQGCADRMAREESASQADIIQQSPLTNSVIRQGDPRTAPTP